MCVCFYRSSDTPSEHYIDYNNDMVLYVKIIYGYNMIPNGQYMTIGYNRIGVYTHRGIER